MNILFGLIHNLLPFFGAILLVMGIKMQRINYIFAALWLSLIALVLDYQTAGSEILGSYFGYKNALLYSLNLIIVITALIYMLFKLPLAHHIFVRYLTAFISACLVVAGLILLINLWINAVFIENRRQDTPIMQVATFKPLDYCNYKYIYYRVNLGDGISYLCPNHYVIIPSVGQLKISPDFLFHHLSQKSPANIKTTNKKTGAP